MASGTFQRSPKVALVLLSLNPYNMGVYGLSQLGHRYRYFGTAVPFRYFNGTFRYFDGTLTVLFDIFTNNPLLYYTFGSRIYT